MHRSSTNSHDPVPRARAPSPGGTAPVPAPSVDTDVTADAARVLVLDDDASLCEMIQEALSLEGHDVVAMSGPEEALAALEAERFDVFLVDVNLGSSNGLQVARAAMDRVPGLVVVVMTAFGTLDTAVGAIRAGAFDFVSKPFELRALALTVARAARSSLLSRDVARLGDLDMRSRVHRSLVGESTAITRVVDLTLRAAASDVTVLIQGESGTGKELVARLLHESSTRADEPFLAINCSALPSNLLESELFGHVRGSFTGASSARDGLMVDAGGGTLFLDEVGEMPPEMQVKLLRALQERRVRPVGSSRERPFAARIVAATNRDLHEEVGAGRFRADLFYRLEVVRVDVPPLRERGNDILLLADHFLRRAAERTGRDVRTFSQECASRLVDYDWPGNVRELENAIERAVALTRWTELAVDDLPARIRGHQPDALQAAGVVDGPMPSLSQLEDEYIARVLSRCEGNKSEAARILGIDRRTLYRKLERSEDDAGHP